MPALACSNISLNFASSSCVFFRRVCSLLIVKCSSCIKAFIFCVNRLISSRLPCLKLNILRVSGLDGLILAKLSVRFWIGFVSHLCTTSDTKKAMTIDCISINMNSFFSAACACCCINLSSGYIDKTPIKVSSRKGWTSLTNTASFCLLIVPFAINNSISPFVFDLPSMLAPCTISLLSKPLIISWLNSWSFR